MSKRCFKNSRSMMQNKTRTIIHSHKGGSNNANKMKSLSCYICKELTEGQKSYRKHLAKIHKKPVYQCWSCTQGFTSRTQLKTHLVSLCTDTSRLMEVFICNECPMFYFNQSGLCSYKQKVHCSNSWLQMVSTENIGFIESDFVPELQVDEKEAKEGVNDDAKEMMKSTNPIICYVCKKVLSNQESYKKHLVKVLIKSASQNLSCVDDFTSKSLLPLNCKSVFKTKLSEKETYTCDECPMIYLNLSSLSNHKQEEHSFGQVSMFDVRNEEEILNTSSDTTKQIISVNKSDNNSNLENKNSKLCYICKEVMSGQKSYKKHLVKAHDKFVYQCLSCFHGFMSRRLLRLHRDSGCRDEMNAHKTYACDECPMIYKKKSGLSQHMQKEHVTDTDILFKINGIEKNRSPAQNVVKQERSAQEMNWKRTETESTIICYLCHDIMSSQKSYKKHLSKVHNKCAYQCLKCNRCCKSKSLLKEHCKFMCKSESVIKQNYVCDLCPIAYTSKKHLLRHKHVEHSIGQNLKKYICKHCGKCLTRSEILKSHENHCLERQKEVKQSARKFCSKCKKDFAARYIAYHKRIVHDKKLHVCGCGEIFRWKSGYHKHLKTCVPLPVK